MKKKGFTLVELMLALSIFTILIGSVYKAYFSEMKELRQITDKNILQYNAKTCIEYITRQLRVKLDESQEINLEDNNTLLKSYNTFENKEVVATLVDIDASDGLSGLINFNQRTGLLTDDKNNVLCRGVKNISLKKETYLNNNSNQNEYGIIITVELQSGKEAITVSTGINISK